MKLIALDVGEKRIGVAKCDTSVRIAVPVGMLAVDGKEIENLIKLVTAYNTDVIVVGMPRNLKGEQTQQSENIKNFVKTLNKTLVLKKPNHKTIKIFFQDESLTSVEAKNRLKNKPVNKQSGEIDAEAAAIILQDFVENLARRIKAPEPPQPSSDPTPPQTPSEPSKKPQFEPYHKNSTKKWTILRTILIILILVGGISFGLFAFYKKITSPAVDPDLCTGAALNNNAETCSTKEVSIPEGSTVSDIASILEQSGVIKSSLGFKLFAKLKGDTNDLKAGNYRMTPYLSLEEILATLKEGSSEDIVFRFTALPGETMKDIKKRLMAIGYEESEIDAAFSKNYDHPVLADKPADASLEGYLFGETYEFYTTDSPETIVIRMLDELYSVVQKNNLKQKFNNLGLTLHEGIILSSIVQKEAGTLSKEDMATVAQVFLSRLNAGIPLGSDVTVKYAVDQVDPNRETYTDNATALSIDSCYNTRIHAGLPCGAISNPSALTLISTANPANTSYLYFLTGDDGMMYYSNTESEHNQNAAEHCRELCNVSL